MIAPSIRVASFPGAPSGRARTPTSGDRPRNEQAPRPREGRADHPVPDQPRGKNPKPDTQKLPVASDGRTFSDHAEQHKVSGPFLAARHVARMWKL